MQAVVLHLRKYVAPRPPGEDVSQDQIEILESQSRLEEFLALCRSAGHQIILVIEQRERPHRKLGGLGRGKLLEIQESVRELHADVLIINRQLQSSVVNQMEDILQIPIIDRIQLILQIFGKRAQSEEANLQVELAKLEYELPRIRRQVRFSLLNERAGFMGVGEHLVNIFLQTSRKRVHHLKQKLADIRVSRQVQRSNRRRFDLIALAGYTGSGKSTLLNQLTEANVPTASSEDITSSSAQNSNVFTRDPGLFTTLTTTTRRLLIRPQHAIGGSRKVTLSDTVGFIEAMPPNLLAPFHSTLEETVSADLLLLVVDASEPKKTIQRKLQICYDTLVRINHQNSDLAILYVLNKTDLLTIDQLADKVDVCLKHLDPSTLDRKNLIDQILAPQNPYSVTERLPLIPISAKQNFNLDFLLHQIYLRLSCKRITAKIPWNSSSHQTINQIYDSSIILSRKDLADYVLIKFEVPTHHRQKIIDVIKQTQGNIEENQQC